MTRQIALDTETTGLEPAEGHRIIEIGCVELMNRKLTGNNFHTYIDPEREIDKGALKVHGISNAFLKNKPKFSEVYSKLLQYIGGAELIIHNAEFDMGFLMHEFRRLKSIIEFKNDILDTLKLARKLHPGQRNSLDALCKRYQVDNSNRKLHGALLDAEILAKVYLAMTGGQRKLFDLSLAERVSVESQSSQHSTSVNSGGKKVWDLPVVKASKDETKADLDYFDIENPR